MSPTKSQLSEQSKEKETKVKKVNHTLSGLGQGDRAMQACLEDLLKCRMQFQSKQEDAAKNKPNKGKKKKKRGGASDAMSSFTEATALDTNLQNMKIVDTNGRLINTSEPWIDYN